MSTFRKLLVLAVFLIPIRYADALSLNAFFSVDDLPCVAGINSVLSRQCVDVSFSSIKALPHISHLIEREFTGLLCWIAMCWMVITALYFFRMFAHPVPISSNALFRRYIGPVKRSIGDSVALSHIGPVVVIGASVQMAWVAARRIIAGVACVKWREVVTKLDKERYAMRFPMDARFGVIKSPIAIAIFIFGDPGPAFVSAALVNACPETSNVCFAKLREWFRIVCSHVTPPMGELVRVGRGVTSAAPTRFCILSHVILLVFACVSATTVASAQAVRFDYFASTTSAQCVSGKLCPLQVIPGTQVSICGGSVSTLSSCLASPATTYTSASAGTSCATTSQLTPQTGGACLASSDSQGNYGFWVSPGSYNYFLRVPATAGGGTYGPYPISIGASTGCPLGAVCDANYATLAIGVAAAGSGTLYVTRAWNNTPSQTVTSGVQFLGNGKIQVAAGATVNLTGPVTCPIYQQCFDTTTNSAAAVTLGQIGPVYPAWFGAKGNDSADDTVAVKAAVKAMCSQPGHAAGGITWGSKSLIIPPSPGTGYLLTSTIPSPCGSYSLGGSGANAPIHYTGTGAIFDTNNQSYLTFHDLFMYGPNVTGQNGIAITGANSAVITVRDNYFVEFGTPPTDSPISTCTSANPIVCTATVAPATGTVTIVGFLGTGWKTLNQAVGITHLSATTFSIPVDGTGLAAFSSPGAFYSNAATISGCGISGTGDHPSLSIIHNTFEVAGTGICLDGTFDLLDISGTNTFGVSGGLDSGWGITYQNGNGAGRGLIAHNNFVTPGGAMNIGPNNGLMDIVWNQYEALPTNAPLSNALGVAYYLNSAASYDFSNNNATLHAVGNGNYCFQALNLNGAIFGPGNTCVEPLKANWNMAGVGTGSRFEYNSDLAGDMSLPYSNMNYPGIRHMGTWTTYEGNGTPYPQATFHYNAPTVPVNFQTTLGAAITSTSQSSITLYAWHAATVYALQFYLIDSNGCLEEVTTAGTSGGSVPSWSSSVCIVASATTDNGVTWTNQGPAPIYIGSLIQIGSEQMAVQTVTFGVNTVLGGIQRGINGTTAATATNGSPVILSQGCWQLTASPVNTSGAALSACVAYDTAYGGPYAYLKANAPGALPWANIPLLLYSSVVKLNPVGADSLVCNAQTEGYLFSIKNANTNTWGAAITTTGAFHVAGYCDGTTLTVFGK